MVTNFRKLRVAWFTELQSTQQSSQHSTQTSAQTYSSYISSQYLPILRDQIDIEVFSSRSETYLGFAVQHYLTARLRHAEQPFDIFFYQLEDRKECQWLRIMSCLYPGISYFHDFLFTSFGPEPILNSPWQGMLKAFNTDTEYWPDLLDEQIQLGPQAFREAAFAGVRIFSQPTALRESKKLIALHVRGNQDVPCYYLPFPVGKQLFERQQINKRRLCLCSGPWLQNRSQQVLEAAAQFDCNLEIVWLLDASELPVAQQTVASLGLKQVEFRIGRSPDQWHSIIKAGGIAIHTLFSVFVQNGPYLPISLAVAAPVVLTRFADSEYIPEQVAFQVQAGETEVSELCKVFELVFERGIQPGPSLVMDFAREHFQREQLATELLFIFRQELNGLDAVKQRWDQFSERASQRLKQQALSLLPDVDNQMELNQTIKAVYNEFSW